MKIVAKVTEGYFMESLVPERCATKKQPKQDVRKISFQKQFKSIFKKKVINQDQNPLKTPTFCQLAVRRCSRATLIYLTHGTPLAQKITVK